LRTTSTKPSASIRYTSDAPLCAAAFAALSSNENETSTGADAASPSFFASPAEAVPDCCCCCWPLFGCDFGGALAGSTLLTPAAHAVPFASTYSDAISFSEDS
jgi:hypothetical protein